MADKDYSATPLATKLGAKPGVDVLLFFTTSRAELQRRFAVLKKTLAPADASGLRGPRRPR
ncbi:MAG TPA: hypothetical protein VK613_14445, partial [Gaiellaceae bacterium]|nr:hypothetical protein [Gaiellaceae bacterium]